jgi:ATP-dependent HslUV protease subunit HslV
MLIVADTENSLLISGGGDVVEPDDGLVAIGSGGNYALSAARALVRFGSDLTAIDIARGAMTIAAEICVYTNDQFVFEEL